VVPLAIECLAVLLAMVALDHFLAHCFQAEVIQVFKKTMDASDHFYQLAVFKHTWFFCLFLFGPGSQNIGRPGLGDLQSLFGNPRKLSRKNTLVLKYFQLFHLGLNKNE
jgi:hypothetical protein